MIPLAIVLFLNAGFNVIVWPRFYKRIASDTRARDEAGKATPFLIVHVVLIVIALVLAVVSVLVGIAGLVGAL
ncbi:SCO4848 family membrane protein [Microbacterium sp. NPDC055903]